MLMDGLSWHVYILLLVKWLTAAAVFNAQLFIAYTKGAGVTLDVYLALKEYFNIVHARLCQDHLYRMCDYDG